MANAGGAATAADGDEAPTTVASTVDSASGVRRGPCNTWGSMMSAGYANTSRRTRRRRESAGDGDEGPTARRTRLCSTVGCGRRYTRCRHAHCCSPCSMGHHTDRCDAKWARFRAATLRLRISSCLVPSCQRAAGTGHIHCCGMCAPSAGAQHTEACTERQGLVRAGRRADTSETASNTSAIVVVQEAGMATAQTSPVPMEVDSSTEEADNLVTEAEGSQQYSSSGIDQISGATADTSGPSESTASPFIAVIDLNTLD